MKVQGQTTENNRDSGILSNPLSFVRSGNFYWGDAVIGSRDFSGIFWSLRSGDASRANDLYFNSTDLYVQDIYARGYGFAVRCGS